MTLDTLASGASPRRTSPLAERNPRLLRREATPRAIYISLLRLTQQGIENVKESPGRIESARKLYEQMGAKVKDFYCESSWIAGSFLMIAREML